MNIIRTVIDMIVYVVIVASIYRGKKCLRANQKTDLSKLRDVTGTPIQTQWRSSKQNLEAIDAFCSSKYYRLVVINPLCTLL